VNKKYNFFTLPNSLGRKPIKDALYCGKRMFSGKELKS
jgi:hypothetical protein